MILALIPIFDRRRALGLNIETCFFGLFVEIHQAGIFRVQKPKKYNLCIEIDLEAMLDG